MLGFCHHHQSLQPRYRPIKNKYISPSRKNNDFGSHFSMLRPIYRQLFWIKRALDYLYTMRQRVFESSESLKCFDCVVDGVGRVGWWVGGGRDAG